ncbi:respiratory nitrate reductase 2 subunit alpha [Lelliottia amnigena]|nr:respiratory nitrate reductase 2 subunit alpha [Lelliottia amnigena]
MSKLLDRFRYFKQKGETFADGHGQVYHTNRDWEDSYRQRWQFDKIVRSTHGVNCTGSCSWKIYVKNGLVTWEVQQTDYPRTRPDLPNHEPRGCPRGASYSWYLYSANRLKYPLVRRKLIELWREALSQHSDPVLAWNAIMSDPQKNQKLQTGARARRLYPLKLERTEPADRGRKRLDHQTLRSRSRGRFLTDSGDVDGFLRGRHALSLPAGRNLPELLRLVLRSPTCFTNDLG